MTPFTLSEIWIYPVKSLGGVNLRSAKVQPKGLQYDRRWMLIDQNGVAMTQRVFPEMALFKLKINGENLQIDFKKSGTSISNRIMDMSVAPDSPPIKAQVWNDTVEVLEVDPELSQWFSHHLHTTCKLVSFPEENRRDVDPQYALSNDQVSLADAYPFLIIGERSLDDLNQKLTDPVPMNRFRPNFVFTGGTPFIEDQWRELTIGSIGFTAVKKSDRCVLTTVNQDTAEKSSEPLKTLSTYRKVDNKVYFGQNLIAVDEGIVNEDDVIITG